MSAPEDERRGPDLDFFDHLDSLRRRLVAALFVFLASASVAFAFMDRVLPVVSGPARAAGLGLYATAPFEKLFVHLKVSAILGLAASLPIAAALLASFVAPALDPRTRRRIAPCMAAVLLFMAAGAALSWFVMVPFAVGFFADFAAGDGVLPLWSLGSYVSLVSGLVLAGALVFLAPPFLLALIRLGVVRAGTLAAGRRYAIVGIALAAGVLTPTVDVVSQCVVGAVLWGLFEVTLLAGRFIEPGRSRRGGKEVRNG